MKKQKLLEGSWFISIVVCFIIVGVLFFSVASF